MSARIDHAAEAREWIAEVSKEIVTGVLGRAQAVAAIAQAEATLALVEQQRIANLIALGILVEDEMPETGERGLIYLPPDDVRSCPDIAAALGIGDKR